ncbi:hypothetical protein [Desulforamulus aquiferis]|uniref:Uncharacterized protein n=1 Tax=Desulforamulus aquiferis TaxID=1397668 RepID=A0AAW7ZCD2_9FIRM|nr:hypothetical protein [Desulforamulus aquiferis]MDO7786982.1 hypothetical protein [Desulforamulus aquiferis]RYD03866.1 hypothetical protein N752_17445 [Desulforamulus aquiferis]
MYQNVQQLQSRISNLRSELSSIEQMCRQMQQSEQNNQQQLQQMSQVESNASQQLQRISQTCQRINQELNQLTSMSSQMMSQNQGFQGNQYGSSQYGGQYGQGQQYGTTSYGLAGQNQQTGQFGGNINSVISAATSHQNQGTGFNTSQFGQGQNFGQFGQNQYNQYTQRSGQNFQNQNLGSYGISSAQASYLSQFGNQQTQPYQNNFSTTQFGQ